MSKYNQCTGPVKGKLTVPRNCILENFEARVEFRDVRGLSRNYRGLSRNFRHTIRDFQALKTKDFSRDYFFTFENERNHGKLSQLVFVYLSVYLALAAGGLCSEFDSDLRRKNVVYDEFSVSHIVSTRSFHLKDRVSTWFATDSQASPCLGRSKPFPVVINKTIFIVEGFLLNCGALKLIMVAALSAIPDFHFADTQFAKNLLPLWAFASRRIFVLRSTT